MAHSIRARAVRQSGARFVFFVLTGLASAAPLAAQGADLDPQRVFRARDSAFAPDPTALRSRAIDVSRDAILAQDALVLDLFDGDARVAFRDPSPPAWVGEGAWVGRDPSDPSSQVNLILRGDVVVGTIRSQGALYKVRPLDEAGAFALERIDENRLPGCDVVRGHEIAAAGGHAP